MHGFSGWLSMFRVATAATVYAPMTQATADKSAAMRAAATRRRGAVLPLALVSGTLGVMVDPRWELLGNLSRGALEHCSRPDTVLRSWTGFSRGPRRPRSRRPGARAAADGCRPSPRLSTPSYGPQRRQPQHRIRRRLRALEPDAWPEVDELANSLAMSGTTLPRRLQGEGLNYQRLEDDLRRDIATELLSKSNLSVAEVARERDSRKYRRAGAAPS
jgi:AraC-like DNA-binding protein